ncbi:MAG TPA: aldolase/citrate lyase family protein [Sphingomonadaceae bacterium]|nr:aldolase/citrate lyase family protein [Sphingomonadaceae bacterium]
MTTSTQRPDPREFRKRLINREPLIGTFMKFPGPHATEILGSIGYDFVMLDEEHAPWTRDQLGMGLLAARAFGTAGFVRISRPDAASILSMLDDGAIGVMVPHVTSAEKARDIASWARYRGGQRGSGVGRGGNHGGRTIDEHYDLSDATTTVIAMIEDREAIDRIDEITAVEGIDAFFLGRGDLGLSLSNATGTAPTVNEAVKIIAESVLRNGKALCAVTPNLASDDAKAMADLGVTGLMVGSDHGFMRSNAVAQLAHFEKLMKSGAR